MDFDDVEFGGSSSKVVQVINCPIKCSGTFNSVKVNLKNSNSLKECEKVEQQAQYSPSGSLSVVLSINKDNCSKKTSLSKGAIAGIVIGGAAFVGLLIALIVVILKKKDKKFMNETMVEMNRIANRST